MKTSSKIPQNHAQKPTTTSSNKGFADFIYHNKKPTRQADDKHDLQPDLLNYNQNWVQKVESKIKSVGNQAKNLASRSINSGFKKSNRAPFRDEAVNFRPKKPIKSGFFKKFASRIILISCLLNLLFLGYFASKQYSNFALRKRSNAILISKRIAAEFGNFIDFSELMLSSLNVNFSKTKPDFSEISEKLSDFEKFRQSGYGKESLARQGILYWVDSNHYLVASSIGKIKKPINLANRQYLKNCHLQPGKIQVGSPMIGALSGQLVIPLAVGLVNQKGNFQGSSVLSLQVEDLVENLSRLDDLKLGEFAIVGTDKKILFESTKGYFSENKRFSKLVKQFDLSLNPPEFDFEVNSFFMALKRKQNFFIKARVFGQPFVVFYAISGAKLHDQLLREMRLIGLEALFSLLLMLTIFLKNSQNRS